MLKQVISLTIADFEVFPESTKAISRSACKERDTNLTYSEDDIKLVFVELPKFNKEIDELETLADRWIYFLKSARSIAVVPKNLESIPAIHKAFELADLANCTREELEDLERRERSIDDT